VGSLNATGGSTLSFADGTARTSSLSSGNLSLSSSNIVFDIGTTADQLSLSSGSASLASSTVKLNFLEQIASAQSWTLLSSLEDCSVELPLSAPRFAKVLARLKKSSATSKK
jgi:hypothetical protein